MYTPIRPTAPHMPLLPAFHPSGEGIKEVPEFRRVAIELWMVYGEVEDEVSDHRCFRYALFFQLLHG